MTRRRTRSSNRIPGLATAELAGHRIKYWWKPSPKQRRLGWTNLDCGFDRATAIAAAEARNREVEAAEQQRSITGTAVRAPRKWSFGELVDAYTASDKFHAANGQPPRLKPKTQREYRSQLKWLRSWANDGNLLVDDLTEDMVTDLRDALVAGASPYVAAARIRVLRIVCGYAVKPLRILRVNPASAMDIPEPPKRRKRILHETAHLVVDAALAAGLPHVALAVELGFFSMQREGDLLAATRSNWRAMEDMAEEDRDVLAGPDGQCWGLRLRQEKTGSWVDAIVPPDSHDRVRAALQRSGPVARLDTPIVAMADGTICHEHRLQRDFRSLIDAMVAAAQAKGDNWQVDQLTGLQFRDLRRSGMCWWRDNGATIPMIAAQSGHSIQYTTKILETYLPADGRAAAAGMATALRAESARAKRKKDKAK